MEQNILKDITAVVANWLTAERTLGAIRSFQKFYPDIPVIVVDDDSNEKDKGDFYSAYNSTDNAPNLEYDPDTEKLKNIPGVTFLQVPPHNKHLKSHGTAIDHAIKKIKTRWMLHFHSDYRFLKPGMLEEMTEGLDETYCGAGDSRIRHDKCKALLSVCALYNVELGKKHNCSFEPVIYYNDNTVSSLWDGIDYSKEGPVAIEAGSYYIGKLYNLGYKIKWVSNPHQRYGIHLRWKGDIEEWKEYF